MMGKSCGQRPAEGRIIHPFQDVAYREQIMETAVWICTRSYFPFLTKTWWEGFCGGHSQSLRLKYVRPQQPWTQTQGEITRTFMHSISKQIKNVIRMIEDMIEDKNADGFTVIFWVFLIHFLNLQTDRLSTACSVVFR